MVQPISGESFNNPLELGNRFIDMSRLQLLRAEGDCLERIFSPGHSPRLVWLSWHQCPYSFLPSWMPMKNLRVLEVTGGELETLWQNRSEVNVYYLMKVCFYTIVRYWLPKYTFYRHVQLVKLI